MKMGMGMIVPEINNLPGQRSTGGGGAFEYTAIDNNFSMEFDGSSSYFIISPGQSLGITDSISISVWARFPLNYNGGANPREACIISEDIIGGTGRNFKLQFKGGTNPKQIQFLVWNTDGTQNILQAYNASLTDNQWHHIVATYDGTTNTDGINVYIDTVKTSLTALSTGIRSTSNVGTLIGATRESNPIRELQGNLDELAVWDGSVISESTVQAIYDATANNPGKVADLSETPEGAPAVWYRMGD
jgi:hypothetical protein